MAHINRRFIDKHWGIFLGRGLCAVGFGAYMLYQGGNNIQNMAAIVCIFLLAMGIIDAIGALYSSNKRHGWVNSIIDALLDIAAAMALLFIANGDIVSSLVILSVYTIVSGIVDIFHGFLSTVDPTDRFIRIVAGICGCVMGAVILNAGELEITTFIRFFGVYLLVVGLTSLIYGVHNRSQEVEDTVARKESASSTRKKTAARKPAKKATKSAAKKATRKSTAKRSTKRTK